METNACADICFGWEVADIQNHLKAFSHLCPFLDGCLHRTLGGNSALYRTWLFHAFFFATFIYPIFCIRSRTSGWLREIFIEITSLRLFLLRHSPLPHTGEIPISLVWHKIWTFKFFFFFSSPLCAFSPVLPPLRDPRWGLPSPPHLLCWHWRFMCLCADLEA